MGLESPHRRRPLLIHLDFELRQGAFALQVRATSEARVVALVGPSGAGKTTVLEAIAGLRTPSRGVIRIGSRVLWDSDSGVALEPRRRHVGYVPQDIALFPHLDVRGNILYAASRQGRIPLDRVLEILEIRELFRRRVEGLSGGERQRVAIARALMAAPDLLLLDEPLAAVDSDLRRRIVADLQRVRDELGVPLMYVSHHADEVRTIADWVVVLERGRVVAAGPPGDVLG